MASTLAHWALLFFVALAHTASAAEPILLKAGAIWAAGSGVRLQSNAMTAENPSRPSESGLYIIQREGATTPEWREGIRKAGATIRGYVPENAYIIEVTPEAFDKIVADVEHAQLIEYKARYRVDPRVVEKIERGRAQTNGVEPAAETARTEVYEISLFDRNATERVAAKLRQLAGAEVEAAYGSVIRAKLTDEALETVAGWIEVEWVEIYVPEQLHNNVAVQARRLNVETLWPGGATPLGLTGAGQVVAVADTGLDTGNTGTLHADVRGRVIRAYARGRVNDWSDPNGHGTHVVGSVLGNGANSSSPKIRGVAYEASLIMQSLLDSSGEISAGIGDLQNLFSQAYATENGLPGARIHSNSWGSSQAGKYTSKSQALDAFMFEHPDFLAVFSAGNEGTDANKDGVIDSQSMGAPATAKNCISVGSCENHRTSGGIAGKTYSWWSSSKFSASPIGSDYMTTGPDGAETYGMAASSSRGPCTDGRVKPDIVAPGQQILSLLSSKLTSTLASYYAYNSYYRYNQGTSMAAPLVAGSAALVRQWLVENQHIPNPDGATVKAVLLAGARSMTPGQYGTGAAREIPATYPNNVEGWGLADVGNAVANSRGVQVYDGKVITGGEAQSFPVRVTAVGGKIAVVMAYTDAPASQSSSKQLVNDLDLTVTMPSGTVLYPNSRTSADRVNNVEGVRIDSAEAGTYTVTVRAYAINTPMGTALTGGTANAVRYSLVVNGGNASGSSVPVNDNFSLAMTVSGNSGTTTGTNVGATFQSGEPLLAYQPTATTTVWWKWTAPASGRVQFDTIGTGFDTVMGVYRGSSFSSLAKAAENDDGGGNGTSKCVCDCTRGVTYYICVGGYNAGVGTVRLNWDLTVIAPTPASLSISGSSSVKSGSTATYTCTATMSDGTTMTVAPTWTIISGADFATINSSGTLLAGAVAAPKSVTLQASYTEGGVTKTATKTVTITALSSLSISGSASVLGGSSSTYACTATWSDGTSTTVTPTWTIISGASYASISSSGKLTTVSVTSPQSVVIQASHRAGGVTKTATKTVTITASITLGTAVDNTTLTFTTGGSASWFGQTTTTHDGVDAARSGSITHSQNSWMQTTVTGPGTISFWWSVSSESGCDCLEFLVDGVVRNSISGTGGAWSQKTYSITSGSHTLQWRYRKDYSVSSGQDAGFVDQVTWTPTVLTLSSISISGFADAYAGMPRTYTCTATMSDGTVKSVTPVWTIISGAGFATINSSGTLLAGAVAAPKSVTLQASYTEGGVTKTATKAVTVYPVYALTEALDNSTLTFTTGGSAVWFGQGMTTYDGVDAARSGSITHSQNSWMQTTVTGPGTLSFWWSASSESVSFDYLAFSIDGVQTNKVGGTSGAWTQRTYTLGAGSHTLRWTYQKDGSVSSGKDAGFVDQIVWTAEGADVVIPGVVTLPVAEVDAYMAKYPDLAARAGGDRETFAKLPSVTGKLDAGGNQMYVWQDIVAGTSPMDANDKFRITDIKFEDGEIKVTWCPDLNEGGTKSVRLYKQYGRKTLDAAEGWTSDPESREGEYPFRMVTVEMP